MSKTTRAAIAILISTASLVLVGCSGSTSGAPPTEARPTSADPSMEGTYRWTLTRSEAQAADWRRDADLATLPWTMTVTLDDGTYQLSWQDAEGAETDPVGEYRLDGDQLIVDGFDNNGMPVHMEFTYAVRSDGSLDLTPPPEMSTDDAFVFTSRPWERID